MSTDEIKGFEKLILNIYIYIYIYIYLSGQRILNRKFGRTRLWLCAAAEVSLTEQKKTGDSVLLLVASSTASQFHFT